MSAFGYEDKDFHDNAGAERVQKFTHVLNGLGYVLGPIIGLIRLCAAAVIALQASNYRVYNGDVNQMAAKARATAFAKEMAVRGLIELTWIGGMIVNPLIDAGVIANKLEKFT